MIFTQSYVSSMCESIDHMKLTESKKEFAKAVMRAAIEYANAQHGMYSTVNHRVPVASQTETNASHERAEHRT